MAVSDHELRALSHRCFSDGGISRAELGAGQNFHGRRGKRIPRVRLWLSIGHPWRYGRRRGRCLGDLAFIFDATVTLLRRMSKRENVLRAHRSHFYQRLTITGYSHAPSPRFTPHPRSSLRHSDCWRLPSNRMGCAAIAPLFFSLFCRLSFDSPTPRPGPKKTD